MFTVLSDEDKKKLTDISEYGYVFDWTKNSSLKANTISRIINGDVAGLVEYERQPENLCNYLWLIEVADNYKGTGIAGQLLAYVGRDSLEAGFEGFVVFETKSALYDYYQTKYGAKTIGREKRKRVC